MSSSLKEKDNSSGIDEEELKDNSSPENVNDSSDLVDNMDEDQPIIVDPVVNKDEDKDSSLKESEDLSKGQESDENHQDKVDDSSSISKVDGSKKDKSLNLSNKRVLRSSKGKAKAKSVKLKNLVDKSSKKKPKVTKVSSNVNKTGIKKGKRLSKDRIRANVEDVLKKMDAFTYSSLELLKEDWISSCEKDDNIHLYGVCFTEIKSSHRKVMSRHWKTHQFPEIYKELAEVNL